MAEGPPARGRKDPRCCRGTARSLRAARGAAGTCLRGRRAGVAGIRLGLSVRGDGRSGRCDRARSSTISKRRGRWIAWSAATLASARPRLRCVPPSSPSRAARRSPCSCRRRCSRSSTTRRSPIASPTGRSSIELLSRFRAETQARPPGRRWRRATSTSSSAPTAAAARRAFQGPGPRRSSTRSIGSAYATRSGSRRCVPRSTC